MYSLSKLFPIITNHSMSNLFIYNTNNSIPLTFDKIYFSDILLGMISAVVGFYFLILLLQFRNTKYPNWVIRKIIHFLGGTYISFIVFFFNNILGILCAIGFFAVIFLLFVIFSKGKLLTSYFLLNFRKGEKDFTFLFNTFFTLIVLFISLIIFHNQLVIFISGALVISWADTSGEVFGKTIKSKTYKILNTKSISGSIGVFLVSSISFFIAIVFCKIPITSSMIWKFILGGLLCTVIEAISWRWLDNLCLPIIGNLIMLWIIYTI